MRRRELTGRRAVWKNPLHSSQAASAIAALGVVYGDIGTSPLYALDLLFFYQRGVPLTPDVIFGGISLVIWTLTIVVAIKYAIFVLRADNDGEGGVFAIYGLLDKVNRNGRSLLAWSLLLGAGLLFGDGAITPAISVLSAVEGLSIATPTFSTAVVPITLLLLTLLFLVQRKGSRGVGRVFGPIMAAWFFVMAVLGIVQISQRPEILKAFDPLYGLALLAHGDLHAGLLALGAVMLVVTGGEAMYADMGHFGARPIRIGWFSVVYPALLINYLGQGAYLLSGAAHPGAGLFFSMTPREFLYPTVALATAATVIASQSLISGTFSLTSQAIALGFFPRIRIVHTHQDQAGEVYAPFVNWVLYLACTALVIWFGSSNALGAAYGLAVSGVMVTTSTAMYLVAVHCWGWGRLRAISLFGALALIDFCFLIANSLKFMEGGYVPLTIGAIVFSIIAIWTWGRKITYAAYVSKRTMSMDALIDIHRQASHFIERTAVLMVPAPARVRPNADRTPTLLQLLWTRNGMLPRNVIFVQVIHPKIPYIREDRFKVTMLERSDKGSIVRVEMRFGYMETPNVEYALKELATLEQIDLDIDRRNWIVHVAHEHLMASHTMPLISKFRLKVFEFLRLISLPTYFRYGLGDDVQLSVEILSVRVK